MSAERADRSRSATAAFAARQQRHAGTGSADAILQRPSPLTANARVWGWRPWPASAAPCSARVCPRGAAARTPPATSARVAGPSGSSTAAASCGYAFEPHERVNAEPARLPPACRARVVFARPAAARARRTARTCAITPARSVARPRVADQSQAPRRRCPAPAASDRRALAIERIARALVAEQAERERRHLPHFGIGSPASSPTSGVHSVLQSDAADRERGAGVEFALRRPSSSLTRSVGGGGGAIDRHGRCPRRAGGRRRRRGAMSGAGSRRTRRSSSRRIDAIFCIEASDRSGVFGGAAAGGGRARGCAECEQQNARRNGS